MSGGAIGSRIAAYRDREPPNRIGSRMTSNISMQQRDSALGSGSQGLSGVGCG